MPGQQLIMDFPVTATSHLLPDYQARGGYQSLRRTLTTLKPEEVTKEITASGMLGHGGAAFPVGRKWAVIKLDELVVTGTAGATQKKEIGNSVTSLAVSDLVDVAPIQSVTELLNARAPGLTITAN